MEAFADVVHSGKAHYIGVSEWRAEEIRRAHELARELHDPVRLEPAAVQHALARDRGRGGPDLRGARHRPDRVVADRAGRAHRQVPARASSRRPGSRATDDKGGADMIARCLDDDVLTRVQQLTPIADEAGLSPGPAGRGLGAAEPQRLGGDHRRLAGPSRCTENVKAAGVRARRGDLLQADRRDPRTRSSSGIRRRPGRRRSGTSEPVPPAPVRLSGGGLAHYPRCSREAPGRRACRTRPQPPREAPGTAEPM